MTESKRKEDLKEGMGKSATPVGNAKTCRPVWSLYGHKRHEHTRKAARSRVGTGHPDQGSPSLQGWLSYTVSVLGCFEPVACLLSD